MSVQPVTASTAGGISRGDGALVFVFVGGKSDSCVCVCKCVTCANNVAQSCAP